MGIFNLFKKPPKVQDDFFGELTFIRSKHPHQCYFEGKLYFKPTGTNFDISVPGNETGPARGQKEFFSNLLENFDNYIEKMKPLIEGEFRNWKEGFEIKDFNKEFTIDHMSAPGLEPKPLQWEISFATVHDKNHWVSVTFENDSPIGVLIDG